MAPPACPEVARCNLGARDLCRTALITNPHTVALVHHLLHDNLKMGCATGQRAAMQHTERVMLHVHDHKYS